MYVVLLVVLILASVGFAVCMALRGPLIRASEDRYGLSLARESITEARKLRLSEHTTSTELGAKIKEQLKILNEVETSLKKAEQQVRLSPKQSFEIVFELGAPGPGMQAYEFVVTRNRRPQRPREFQGPEAALHARPRIVRAWSRNQTGAIAMAQSRFASMDGFTLRVAERLDHAVVPSDSRA